MEIRVFENDVIFSLDANGLKLTSRGKTLLEGFSDVGNQFNGLLPVVYYESKKLMYLDLDSLEIFTVQNVDWISGLHFVGSNLQYFGHNSRTDIRSSKNETQSFTTLFDCAYHFANVEGVSVEKIEKKVFDHDLQKFNSTNSFKVNITSKTLIKMLEDSKYFQIVGKGVLSKSLNLGGNHFKSDDGGVYHPKQYSLSGGSKYGLMDIRTNELLINCSYNEINVLPGLAITESGILEF